MNGSVGNLGAKRIAVLGANGQVGAELCLLLDIIGELKPIAVARSEYSTALLRMLGIECRHAMGDSVAEMTDLVSDCDVVVDLVYPLQENTAALRERIRHRAGIVCAAMKAAATLIYASTMSVYRLDPSQPSYTIYGRTKLYAERAAARAGRRAGREVFIFRLGQVHGPMQSCSNNLVRHLKHHSKIQVPALASFTIFVSSIAEAVGHVARGGIKPACYTLISTPAWSCEELVSWWAREAGLEVAIRQSAKSRHLPSFKTVIATKARAFLVRHRDRISDYAWQLAPSIAAGSKFQYHRRLAASSIESYKYAAYSQPLDQQISIPGERFPGLTDSRETMPPLHAALNQRLQSL